MFAKKLAILAGVAVIGISALASVSTASAADKLMTIIVNNPSNPYWQTEGNVAADEAKRLGYKANVVAHNGDTNTERNQIDTAITNHSAAIILDPANADGSIGSVKKAVAADIPVIIVNAEINEQGLAKAQLVSNNAQGAALGAMQWIKAMGTTDANYAELKGPPSDNNAATRANGYKTVLSQYPSLKQVASQVASWDRTQGHNKMQGMLQANPNIKGVISGNDDMALGAISALKEAGKLDQVTVGGFDGSPAAIDLEADFTMLSTAQARAGLASNRAGPRPHGIVSPALKQP